MESAHKEELFKQYFLTKDIETRNQLFNYYNHLPEIIAKKFTSRGVEFDDLYQVGCIALLEALERFEPDKGVQFQTFASSTIIGKIKNYLRDKSALIRLPRKNFELLHKIKNAKETLSQSKGRIPNVTEIAEHLQIDEEIVLESLEAQYNCDLVSLDSLLSVEYEEQLSSVLGKEDTSYSAIEDLDFLKSNIESFDEIEQKIIFERFFNEKTQSEIAVLLNVSQMHISRLERKILEKLKYIFLG